MKSKGKEGENLAVDYLLNKGYELLARNYRFKRAEVDVIVKKDKLLCFVEVKLRSSIEFGHPEDFVSENQKRLIIAAADNFVHEINWQDDIRFDIVALTQDGSKIEFMHFQDAFY